MGHVTKRQLVIHLKQEGSENDFQNLLSSKQCWNSGSTLDKSTSTLNWRWEGVGGKKGYMLGKVQSRIVPRIVTHSTFQEKHESQLS